MIKKIRSSFEARCGVKIGIGRHIAVGRRAHGIRLVNVRSRPKRTDIV